MAINKHWRTHRDGGDDKMEEMKYQLKEFLVKKEVDISESSDIKPSFDLLTSNVKVEKE